MFSFLRFLHLFCSQYNLSCSAQIVMGNAHVATARRMGVQASASEPIHWAKEEPFVFSKLEGVEPAMLTAELHVDKLVKFERTKFVWVRQCFCS
jgi:hypothetical protein